MAIALIVDAKKGLSAKQLQAHLGIGSYKTAWYICHRVRKAMVDSDPKPLSGVVEIDETYIGGTAIRRFQKNPKPKPPKEMVLAMRERNTKNNTGRVTLLPYSRRQTGQRYSPSSNQHLADNSAAHLSPMTPLSTTSR